ncbi:hypothetical protein [Brevundimonas sp.]|uniref:hypothetical protein n=1 Tax=Brevundimonas sp. TaxID=1871086 RepID=UPI0025BE1077|nr:hypothetical protein [Brevundimonas sp.]
MKHPSLILSGALSLALSGCLGADMISTRSAGAPYPQEAGSQVVFIEDPGPMRDLVSEALAARGPRIVDDAPLMVEATLTERPEHAGAFVGERPTTDRDWLAAPSRTPWWRSPARMKTLTLRLIDGRTGQELRRAEAAHRVRPGREHRAPPPAELARQAVDALLATDPATPRED